MLLHEHRDRGAARGKGRTHLSAAAEVVLETLLQICVTPVAGAERVCSETLLVRYPSSAAANEPIAVAAAVVMEVVLPVVRVVPYATGRTEVFTPESVNARIRSNAPPPKPGCCRRPGRIVEIVDVGPYIGSVGALLDSGRVERLGAARGVPGDRGDAPGVTEIEKVAEFDDEHIGVGIDRERFGYADR